MIMKVVLLNEMILCAVSNCSSSGVLLSRTIVMRQSHEYFVTAAWCEPTLHICGIGMASTLQHGVKRHCLTKPRLRCIMQGGHSSGFPGRGAIGTAHHLHHAVQERCVI